MGWLSRLFASAAAGRANERGIALWQRGDYAPAEAAFREALKRNPSYAAAAGNLGMVLAAQSRWDEALAVLRQAVEDNPRHAGARVNLAWMLQKGGRMAETVEQLREALAIAPGDPAAQANLLKPLMELCDWPAVTAMVEEFRRLDATQPLEHWGARLLPYESLLLPFDPDLQLRLARFHAARDGTGKRAVRAPRQGGDGRLRIGYLSADFHDHVTAHLTLSLYGRHDRSRFAVHAYSLGQADDGTYRRRIAADCDQFLDAGAMSDAQLAQRIADDGIDVLMDMNVRTGGARPGVLARRPAAVQVNFLGYPGTSGADYFDYLLADRVVVPEGGERHYSEAIIRMPASYQSTDNRQAIAGECPPRIACGLPEQGFVYCCFNQLYKVEPVMFGAWMDILKAVPGSVLWLLSGQPLAEQRLRDAAAAAGVAPQRLVFAPRAAKAEHLARHRHAGLFLDTHDCNAHTTATDALWANVPVLTWPGATFASRVAASLVTAAGLPELIMPTLDRYRNTAIRLGREPLALTQLRDKLARQRLDAPLFDTPAYVRDLESAYVTMVERMRVRVDGGPGVK